MMETYPIEDIIEDLTESSESTDILEESLVVDEEETTEEVLEESIEEQEESTEEQEESTEEVQTSLLADSTSYDDAALLSSLSVTNGLLYAILFVLIARWCSEKIESGIRRLLKDE